MMQLLFVRRPTLACAAIRVATWSPWSHVAAVFGGTVFEATVRHGVRKTLPSVVLANSVDHAWAEVPCRTDPTLRFLEAQLGKPYDWTAIFGIMTRRDWQEDDSWFCSELVATAADAGGVSLIHKPKNRVTPGDLWSSPVVRGHDGSV